LQITGTSHGQATITWAWGKECLALKETFGGREDGRVSARASSVGELEEKRRSRRKHTDEERKEDQVSFHIRFGGNEREKRLTFTHVGSILLGKEDEGETSRYNWGAVN